MKWVENTSPWPWHTVTPDEVRHRGVSAVHQGGVADPSQGPFLSDE